MTSDNTQQDPAEVAAQVHDGDVVCTSGNGSFPVHFVRELAKRQELKDVLLHHPMRIYDIDPANDYLGQGAAAGITHVSDFTWDVPVREAIRAGKATFRPNSPHEAAQTWAHSHQVDLYVAQASLPDRHGYVSLGAFGGWSKMFINRAAPKKLVLELNARQPRVLGDVSLPLTAVDAYYEVDYALPSASLAGEPTDIETRIADHVAELIPDEATLQIGIGTVPDIIVRRLIDAGRRHLGVHSENFSDSLVELVTSGVADNSRKTTHRGITVCTLAVGTERVYDFMDDNPGVAMLPSDYVNDPAVIAANPKQFAINATLTVDLMGQCASESLAGRHYSGSGGQWEFVFGANHSPGGRAIITLPSTAKGDSLSTIVPMLPQGEAVTIPRHDSPTIVTEHGVADLRGKSIHERARELIAISHPKFREQLTHSARSLGYLP